MAQAPTPDVKEPEVKEKGKQLLELLNELKLKKDEMDEIAKLIKEYLPEEMAQKPRQKKRLKNFRLSDEQERMLEEIARHMGTTESEALRLLIVKAYSELKNSPLFSKKLIEENPQKAPQEGNPQEGSAQ
jgi:predicted DNA-binding protein